MMRHTEAILAVSGPTPEVFLQLDTIHVCLQLDLIYGGHVLDSADLEAVEAVCRVCLHQTPPSDPHVLQNAEIKHPAK